MSPAVSLCPPLIEAGVGLSAQGPIVYLLLAAQTSNTGLPSSGALCLLCFHGGQRKGSFPGQRDQSVARRWDRFLLLPATLGFSMVDSSPFVSSWGRQGPRVWPMLLKRSISGKGARQHRPGYHLRGRWPWAPVGMSGLLGQVSPVYENPGFALKIKTEVERKGKEL